MSNSLIDNLIIIDENTVGLNSHIVDPLKPELNLIEDETLRKLVAIVLSKTIPIWLAPATNVPEAHPPDEYDLGGMILHIKRTVRAAFLLCSTHIMDEEDIMCLIAAALLHTVAMPIPISEMTPDSEIEFVFNGHYMVAADDVIQQALESALIEGAAYPTDGIGDEDRYNILFGRIMRLIHCCEGIFAPIPELVPESRLEVMMAAANMIAKSVHVISDGPDIIEERWKI